MNPYVLLRISRPLFWPIPPIIFAVALKVSGGSFTTDSLTQLFLLTLPYCFILFGINAVYDFKTDSANTNKKLFFRGLLLPQQYHQTTLHISFALAIAIIASAVATTNIENIVAAVLLLVLSYIYSAPPIRLKVHPPLDALSNGAAFMAIWFMGASYAVSLSEVPLVIYALAFGVVAAHLHSTSWDVSADRQSDTKTFSTVYGARTANSIAALLLLAIGTFAGIQSPLLRGAIFYGALLFGGAAIINKEKASLRIGLLLLLSSIAVALLFYQQLY